MVAEPRSLVAAFQHYLKQIERRNWEGKIFYHPSDIKSWMNTTQESETYPNVTRLLGDMHSDTFARISADQCAQYLLVLAALLHPDVSCENLIHVFTRYNLSDKELSHPDLKYYYEGIVTDLKNELPCPSLPSKYGEYDYRAATVAFDRARWAFCPASLSLHMDTHFPYKNLILPFIHGKVINKKGGTANVHHYKIQEDLVESSELKEALASSRHKVPGIGICFEFAVKSYFNGWEDIYQLESQAFRGVRDQIGVVKFLGEYHFREEEVTSPTHNIILEYGQKDLDEYLADTYPPVLSTEIFAFWDGFFKVAHTLKRLHQLKYEGEDGRVQKFKGWHGDIKPDNILRVREEFKLADFGFTKFEKDVSGKSSTFLAGTTRTYGAPECDLQGSDHLQTIDTWSFGCVLSAVATWAVLGSQAYDNYRQVRMMEISQLRQHVKDGKGGTAPSGDDAFHDGTKVLPSVLHWHTFLRNSSRKADTISSRVLNLVEANMLLERPADRLTFEKLCEELEKILLDAKSEYKRALEEGDLQKIEPDTLQALLRLDKHAPAQATPIVQVDTDQTLTHGHDSGPLLPFVQSQLRPTSDRVKKSERLDRIIIGKTANREEAIKFDLSHSCMTVDGELCESPEQDPVDADIHSSGAFHPVKNSGHQPASSTTEKEVEVPQIQFVKDSPVAAQIRKLSHTNVINESSQAKHSQQSLRYSEPPNGSLDANPFFSTNATLSLQSQLSKNPPQEESKNLGHGSNFAKDEDITVRNPGDALGVPVTPPQASRAPIRQSTIKEPVPPGHEYNQLTIPGSTPALPPSPPKSPENFSGYGAVRLPIQFPDINEMNWPSYEGSAMFKERARLEKLWGDKKGHFSSLFSKVPRDSYLENFISDRDIVFVVDNAMSMKPHWPVVEKVVGTLAMMIGSLDTDGLDLVYTISQNHGVKGIRGWDIPKKFEHSLRDEGRKITERYNTNMKETLERIFDEYKNINKRRTLIILTDGLWKGCKSDDDVQNVIASFITELEDRLKKILNKRQSRWFSIQFISFGNDEAALNRLKKLDDNMPIKQDVIDTKPWYHEKVDKLILGSMTDDGDKDPPSLLPPSPSAGPSRTSTSASNHTRDVLLGRTPSTRSSSKSGKVFNFIRGK